MEEDVPAELLVGSADAIKGPSDYALDGSNVTCVQPDEVEARKSCMVKPCFVQQVQ